MQHRHLSLLVLPLLLAAVEVKGQQTTADYCPSECECTENSSSGLVTATCDHLTDLHRLDFTRKEPPVRDLRLVITNSDIPEVNREVLDSFATNAMTVVIQNSYIGVFHAGSLDIPSLSQFSMDLQDSTIDLIESEAMATEGGNVQALVFRQSSISTIKTRAFVNARFNLIDWADVTVDNMNDGAFQGSRIVTLKLHHVTMSKGSEPFTQLNMIRRLQLSYVDFPKFPQDLIPASFAESQQDAESIYMRNCRFTYIEDRAFQDAYSPDESFQYMDYLRASEFHENTVVCDVRTDWMQPLPAYLPEEFYNSLVCTAPEEYCGAKLHTCEQLHEDGDLNTCDFYPNFDCSAAATPMASCSAALAVALACVALVWFQ